MLRFTVAIILNGETLDTRTVSAADEWKARTAAMGQALTAANAEGRTLFPSGSFIEYNVTPAA